NRLAQNDSRLAKYSGQAQQGDALIEQIGPRRRKVSATGHNYTIRASNGGNCRIDGHTVVAVSIIVARCLDQQTIEQCGPLNLRSRISRESKWSDSINPKTVHSPGRIS